jgi:hypothetical protein
MIGLPFTVYRLPHALRSAFSALRHGGSPKPGPLGLDFLCFLGTMFALNVSKVSVWLTNTISLF